MSDGLDLALHLDRLVGFGALAAQIRVFVQEIRLRDEEEKEMVAECAARAHVQQFCLTG